MSGRKETGKIGEEIALEWLSGRGFVLRERNWRKGHEEVDLIMESERWLHIVEVKTLHDPARMEPQEQVDSRKVRHLARAASAYIGSRGITKEVHFDVVSVLIGKDGVRVEYIPEAFYPIFCSKRVLE